MGFLATLSNPSSKVIEKSEYDRATLEFVMGYDNRELVNKTEAEIDQIISELYKRAEEQCDQIISVIKSEAEYEQLSSELTTSYDNREPVGVTEAEHGQVGSELTATYDNRELVSVTEAEHGQVSSGLTASYDNWEPVGVTEAEHGQAGSGHTASYDNREPVGLTEAEHGQVGSEFTASCDNRELVGGADAEIDQIISELYKRTEEQCNQIISITRSESRYDQVSSELASSYDDQELVDKTEAEYDQIISDLFERAEDQCNQIISIIKKALETDVEYIEACCDLESACEDKKDFTELHEDDTQMRTIKHFRLHIDTCDIYAIEQRADASLVGSCGPLAEDDLKDLDSYDYSDKQNAWVQKNLDRLILWFP